jgi:hypothetical protein
MDEQAVSEPESNTQRHRQAILGLILDEREVDRDQVRNQAITVEIHREVEALKPVFEAYEKMLAAEELWEATAPVIGLVEIDDAVGRGAAEALQEEAKARKENARQGFDRRRSDPGVDWHVARLRLLLKIRQDADAPLVRVVDLG